MNQRKFTKDAKRLIGLWGKKPGVSLKLFENLIATLRANLNGRQLLFLVLYKVWVCLYSVENGGCPSVVFGTFHDDDKKLLKDMTIEENIYLGLSSALSFSLTSLEWDSVDEAIQMLEGAA